MSSSSETMKDSPTPETDRSSPIFILSDVFLRPYQPSDASTIAQKANSPLVAQNMTNAFPNPYTLADAESWLKLATTATSASLKHPSSNPDPPVFLNYAICSVKNGAYLGGIGLKPLPDVEYRTMEIGYWLGEDSWGKGIMTEVVKAFVKWTFETFPDLLRIEGRVYGYNERSANVLRRAGFKQDGVRRQAGEKNGKVFDVIIFGITGQDVIEV